MRHYVEVAGDQAEPLLNGREGTRTLETTLAVKRAATTDKRSSSPKTWLGRRAAYPPDRPLKDL